MVPFRSATMGSDRMQSGGREHEGGGTMDWGGRAGVRRDSGWVLGDVRNYLGIRARCSII